MDACTLLIAEHVMCTLHKIKQFHKATVSNTNENSNEKQQQIL